MRHFYLLFICFLPFVLWSQVKYDNNWFLATQSSANQEYGLSRIDFGQTLPFAEKVPGYNIDINETNCSWSDSSGTFKYFTNGCVIVNADYEVMGNGDSINPGVIHDDLCTYGYPIPQGMIILPKPDADTIGIYDGFLSWLPTAFFRMQLMPDNKIYMTTANGTNVMHVIQQPDLKGTACQFEQHTFQLPRYYSFDPPNFPNYRLGAAPDGYCDSLLLPSKNPTPSEISLLIYPNPVDDLLIVEFPEGIESQQMTILNALGEQVYFNFQRVDTTLKINTVGWANGVYYLSVRLSNNRSFVAKFLVLSH